MKRISHRLLGTISLSALLAGPVLVHAADNDELRLAQSQAEQDGNKLGDTMGNAAENAGEALDEARDSLAEGIEEVTGELETVQTSDGVVMAEPANVYSANKILGAAVYGATDESIGSVADLGFSEDGEINTVVLQSGGIFGLGGNETAIGTGKVSFSRIGKDEIHISTPLAESDFEQMNDASDEMDAGGLTVEENLIGRSVVNSAGEKIASVHDILVTDKGEITHYILAEGEILGMGGRLTAVEFDGYQTEEGGTEGAIVLPITSEELERMQEFRYRSDLE